MTDEISYIAGNAIEKITVPLNASLSQSRFGEPSFSLVNRIIRAIWALAWLLFASWTPPQMHAWRRLILIVFGAKIGKGARVYSSASIWYPANLTMGRYAVIGWKVNCYNQAPIVLEDFAVVSQFSHLVTGSHLIDDPDFQLVTKPIIIKEYAWVASCAFVGPGVTIHEGAVLGGGGVTFRSLNAWTVYAGNPCKRIKARNRFTVERA